MAELSFSTTREGDNNNELTSVVDTQTGARLDVDVYYGGPGSQRTHQTKREIKIVENQESTLMRRTAAAGRAKRKLEAKKIAKKKDDAKQRLKDKKKRKSDPETRKPQVERTSTNTWLFGKLVVWFCMFFIVCYVLGSSDCHHSNTHHLPVADGVQTQAMPCPARAWRARR